MTGVFEIATGVLSVLTIGLGALSGLIYGTLKVLRDSNGDLRLRVAELEEKTAQQDRRIEDRDLEIAALQRSVRGDEKLDVAIAGLDAHHDAAVAHWRRHEELLGSIQECLTRMGGAA